MVLFLSRNYFLVKTLRQNPYRSYVQTPVATRLPMYDVGGLSTMTEVNRRQPKTAKRDTPVPIPRPKALTVTTAGGRAQTRVQHRPPTLSITPTTMERSSTIKKTYEPTPKEVLMKDTSTTRPYVIIQGPNQARTPEDPPEAPIPPKPPYADLPTGL